MIRLQVAKSFERDLRQLPIQERERIHSTFRTFISDPRSRGLNMEKLRKDKSLFTIRVNKRYRVLLRKRNNLYVAVSVLHHDRAYR